MFLRKATAIVWLVVCLTVPAGHLSASAPAQPGSNPAPALLPSLEDIKPRLKNLGGAQVEVGEPVPLPWRFSIAIPGRDWLMVREESLKPIVPSPAAAALTPTRLAAFVSPQGPQAGLLEVFGLALTRELAHPDWLMVSLLQSGAQVQGRGHLESTPVGMSPQVFAKIPQKSGEPEIWMRAAAFRNGERIFLVRCLANADIYPSLADAFAAATLFFRPKDLQPDKRLGQWQERCLGQVCFQVPQPPDVKINKVEWQGRPVREEAFELELGGLAAATIHLKVVLPPEAQETAPLDRIKNVLYGLRQQGFTEKWLGAPSEGKLTSLPGEARFFHGRTRAKQKDWEFFAVAVGSDSRAVLAWMLTPAPDQDPQAWLYSKRVFDILCLSLSLKPAGAK